MKIISILCSSLFAVFFAIAVSAAEPAYKGKTAEQWLEMLADQDGSISGKAFEELANADASGGGVLQVFLANPHPGLRGIAAMGFNHMAPAYPQAIPALTEAVLDVSLNVRYWALSALKKYGSEARKAVPNIITALETHKGTGPALDGPDRYYADARALAADALGSMGPDAKAAVPALEKALQDPSPMVRAAAKRAIKSIK